MEVITCKASWMPKWTNLGDCEIKMSVNESLEAVEMASGTVAAIEMEAFKDINQRVTVVNSGARQTIEPMNSINIMLPQRSKLSQLASN